MSSGLTVPPPLTLTAPLGVATLPLVELDRVAVVSANKPIRLRKGSKKRAAANCSFGDFDSEHLKVDAWPLFHAAKKTELATSFTQSQVDRRALCFAAEFAELFIWNGGNLRRIDRSVFALEDFSEAGLAGRFGEAIAYLTMQKWGYVYFDRIATLWERAVAGSGVAHAERVKQAQIVSSKLGLPRPDLEPDFAFEKATGDVAMMESKGSFVHPVNDNPTTKNDLRHALEQISAWTGMITPTPAKSYAIGTYFRDISDVTGDPSLVTYVDPPGRRDDDIRPIEFRPDWIRRGNYGAWLVGMGFQKSGNTLRAGIELVQPEREIPIVRIGGNDIAIVIENVIFDQSMRQRGRFLNFWPLAWNSLYELTQLPGDFLRELGITGFQVMGIDKNILRRIEQSVLNSASMSLFEDQVNVSEGAQSLDDKVANHSRADL